MAAAVSVDLFTRRARQLPPPLEVQTHIAIADMLRVSARRDWFWSHIPGGEYRTDATAAKLPRMGFRPGMFDFLLIGPDGRHCWLELKRGRLGRLSDAQERFREHLRAGDVSHAVARNYDEALAALQSWGAVRVAD